MLKRLLDKLTGAGAPPSRPRPPVEQPPPAAPVTARAPSIDRIDWQAARQQRFLAESVSRRAGAKVLEALPEVLPPDRESPSLLDAALLYTLMGEFEPTRIMEIGSGASTRVLDMARRDFHLPGELIAVDPAPPLDLTEIVDAHVEKSVESLPREDFEILQAGEFLLLHLTNDRGEPTPGLAHFTGELLTAIPEGVLLGVLGFPHPFDTSESAAPEVRNALAELLDHLRAHPPLEILASPAVTDDHLATELEKELPPFFHRGRPGLLLLRLSAPAGGAAGA